MHVVPGLKVLYFGTPVVLISSLNEDGTANLAPMSSAWWLGQSCMLGLANHAQTTANLHREGECVLNLPSSAMVDAVDRIALTTGKPSVPDYKAKQGYRHEPDKYSTARLTEQASDLVRAPRVAECPIQLECRVVSAHPLGGPEPYATAFEVEVLRAHVEEDLVIPGTHYVDPLGWDPLIMKFCEFFGGGRNVHPSRLAEGWNMPHQLQPTTV
ncbi:flavin reductase family protein [Streptomyces neyagawaensis]|uniref:flavin reductase family protein n=1 Tax=Streptomyces neyagawaensis TaxID=42238 RepID=UPI0006E247FD|nr:flavin reductase family protein [Streptomyces neyagawaensis]MCL6731051.1 flavin reductase family protein [Streptomyces neyagawaensis]MDE1686227.1 flavin reductase family protein [Streptomyces neyagawaensis]